MDSNQNKNDPWGKSENTWDKRKGDGGDGAWEKNSGDGIGRPNAKSNVGSSWVEKDNMESDEHLKVRKESNTWNIGKSSESPWDNTDALHDSWVNSATHNNNA